MADIRRAFLDLRGQIQPGQRPFKFHYYNMSSFEHPDRDWEDEQRKKLRKCKHILVSLDENAVPMTQGEYRDQILTFIGHLLKVVHDKTCPIWFLSANELPMQASNCRDPRILPRTTDHPCNDVLKDLFLSRAKDAIFPREQVRFLDNTDLSAPRFDEDRDAVLAVIAIRIFVLVGAQVTEWRAMGQEGKIDGLHRNGAVEPNFELVPYQGWW